MAFRGLRLSAIPEFLFGPGKTRPGYLAARWVFLRGLGLIFFSAFYSLAFQIRGLIGPHGILPARDYLAGVASTLGGWRFWFAPSVFWWSASDRAASGGLLRGMLASLAVGAEHLSARHARGVPDRFVSFISTAREFASYQSDGMLL